MMMLMMPLAACISLSLGMLEVVGAAAYAVAASEVAATGVVVVVAAAAFSDCEIVKGVVVIEIG